MHRPMQAQLHFHNDWQRAFGIRNISPEEVGRAEFNVATPTYPTIAYSVQ